MLFLIALSFVIYIAISRQNMGRIIGTMAYVLV